MTVVQLDHPGGAATDATSTLGGGTVEGIINKGFEPAADRIALGPNDDGGTRVVELLGRVGDPADIVRGIMINPGGLVSVLGAVIVGAGRPVVDGNGTFYDFHIGLGFALASSIPGRADLAAGGVLGREFFRVLTVDKQRLFVAEPGVRAQTRGVVAPRGVGAEAAGVEIHAAVELDEDVSRRAVGARENGQRAAALHHGNGGLVGIRNRRGAVRVAAIVQAIGVEGRIAIAPVLAGDGDPRHLLESAVGRVALVKRDGRLGPEGGKLRGAPAENEVAAGRDGHGGEVGAVKAGHTAGSPGILVEVGPVAEAVAEGTRLSLRRVVIHHHSHGDLIPGVAAAGGAVRIAVVAALEGEEVAVGPEALLQAAGKVVVDFQDVRDTRVTELAEIGGVGMPRESAARFAEGLGFVIAVGINQPHALAGHVESMLPFFQRGKVAVVAVGVGHAHALGEPAGSGRIEALQAGTRIAESAIEFRAEVVVNQAHARVPVAPVAGWLAEVLAESKGVIARHLVFENGIAVVGVAESTGAVELPLHPAEVAGAVRVLAGAGLLAEEVIRHVLDRVEAEPVGLGAVDRPTRRANQVGTDVLHESPAVGQNVCAGFEADLFIRRPGTQLGPRLIEQDPEISRVAVLVFVIVPGTFEVADERKLRVGRAFRWSEVCVGCLVRDVDQVGQPQVLHLPGAAPIAGVVPLAVESIFGFPEVEILRHHAGIELGLPFASDRGVLIEAGDVEGPVVHDVVEVDPDPEPVRHFHHVPQLGFGAVAGAHRVALVLRSEVEGVPEIIADGQPAGGFGRGRQPEGVVAGLGQLGHFPRHLRPGDVEKLEHRLGVGRRKAPPREDKQNTDDSRQAPPDCGGKLHGGEFQSPRSFSVVKGDGHGFTEKMAYAKTCLLC